ncbi:XRE family transcriptional regulator [Amycolatopsis lurida]
MLEPNRSLRTARERTPSPSAPGECASRAEVAEAVNAWLWSTTGKRHALDAHYLAKLERGVARWPNAAYRSGLRHVLGAATDQDLGFRRPRRNAATTPSGALEPRSIVASGLNGVDLGASPAEFVDRITLETPAPARAGRTEIQQVRAATAALAASENLHGGGLLAEAGTLQLRWAARLLNAQVQERSRAALFESVGNLSGVVAFSAFDMGDHGAAARCFQFSLWCAEQGQSWELRAATLADMARQAVYVGDLDSALTLIEHAQVRADRLSATGRTVVSVVRARLLALLGRHDDARAEVERADMYFADRHPATDPLWLTYYDDAEHAGSTARALIPLAVLTREPGVPAERLSKAISIHTDGYRRSRAFSRIRLATLMMAAGDPHEGVVLGRLALEDAADLHSQRVSDELRGLRAAADRHGDIPDAADLAHELLIAGRA